MVSMALPLPIPFIPCVAKPFPCCPSALPGEKNGSSFSIRRPTRFVPCHWPGRISPCLILFCLRLPAKLCYVLVTCNSSRSSSGRSRLTIRRITDMAQHVTAHHLTRLACLYVRQSTLKPRDGEYGKYFPPICLARSSSSAGVGRRAHCRD